MFTHGSFAIAIVVILIGAERASAENWVMPFENDRWLWVDLDSAKTGSNGDRVFAMWHGDKPGVRDEMSYSFWVSLNCSTGHYYETDQNGAWDKGHPYDDYYSGGLMRLACR